jgi:protein phosphatase
MLSWDERLQHAALTDIGMRRGTNQDDHAAHLAGDYEAWTKRGHFFMVADGMGAHAAGELASQLAVKGVPHRYLKYVDLSPPEALQRAVVETNAEVHRRGQASSDFHNMGTTASVLVLLPQGALMAHIGDSRVYRLRGNRLEQLTKDHSLIWELRDQLAGDGDLAIPRNVITRSLGPNATVQVDIEGPLRIAAGDTFLVCSDGLTGRVSDEELAPVLRDLPPDEAAHLLIDLANLRGGPDNITVIIIKVVRDVADSDNAEPLTIGTKRHTVQPAIWVCVAVCALAMLVLAFTGNPIPALVAAAGGVVALILGWFSRHMTLRAGTALNEERKLGSGPYTQTICGSSEQSTTLLGGITRELRASTNDELRELDWSDFDTHCQAAQDAQDQTNLADAMRSYARAIRYLMDQVKENQNRRSSDSTIDL